MNILRSITFIAECTLRVFLGGILPIHTFHICENVCVTFRVIYTFPAYM